MSSLSQLSLGAEARGRLWRAVGGGCSVLLLAWRQGVTDILLRCHNDPADIILISLWQQGAFSQHWLTDSDLRQMWEKILVSAFNALKFQITEQWIHRIQSYTTAGFQYVVNFKPGMWQNKVDAEQFVWQLKKKTLKCASNGHYSPTMQHAVELEELLTAGNN